MLQQVMQAVRSGEYRAPRTILAFLGSLVAISAGTAVGLAFALSGVSSLHYLIVGFVVFVLLLVCACGGVVVFFAWKDPSKLMLGQVTAQDYIAIQKHTMGDDVYGEYVELPAQRALATRSDEQSSEPPPALPAEESPDDDA
jgi:hypothetical protein